MIKSKSAPMFTKDWMVITKVLNIMCKLFPPLLSSLRILSILNDLNNVTAPLISNAVYEEMTMLNPDVIATIKSKVFQPSLKKTMKPWPIILINTSRANIAVKM
jgi:hypothetical protein